MLAKISIYNRTQPDQFITKIPAFTNTVVYFNDSSLFE